jgi:hypothetical protein
VKILLQLQHIGVQVFLATHDYMFLKELALASTEADDCVYISLYKDNGDVKYSVASTYDEIENNPITEAFDGLLDREIANTMGGDQ